MWLETVPLQKTKVGVVIMTTLDRAKEERRRLESEIYRLEADTKYASKEYNNTMKKINRIRVVLEYLWREYDESVDEVSYMRDEVEDYVNDQRSKILIILNSEAHIRINSESEVINQTFSSDEIERYLSEIKSYLKKI